MNSALTENLFTSMKNSIVKLQHPIILWKNPFNESSTSSIYKASFSPIYYSNMNVCGDENHQVMPLVMKDFRFQLYIIK